MLGVTSSLDLWRTVRLCIGRLQWMEGIRDVPSVSAKFAAADIFSYCCGLNFKKKWKGDRDLTHLKSVIGTRGRCGE